MRSRFLPCASRNLNQDVDEVAGDERLHQRENAVQHAERHHAAEQGRIGVPDQLYDKQQMPDGGFDFFGSGSVRMRSSLILEARRPE